MMRGMVPGVSWCFVTFLSADNDLTAPQPAAGPCPVIDMYISPSRPSTVRRPDDSRAVQNTRRTGQHPTGPPRPRSVLRHGGEHPWLASQNGLGQLRGVEVVGAVVDV